MPVLQVLLPVNFGQIPVKIIPGVTLVAGLVGIAFVGSDEYVARMPTSKP